MWNKLIAYATDFVSFLLYNLDDDTVKKINRIILFGSVARRTSDKKSDLDIFIDIAGEPKTLSAKTDKIENNFYKSMKVKKYWNLLGIKNEIKCIVGKLDEWKDIKRSIISDGIILYGKFIDVPKNGKSLVLFGWENIRPNSKRVLFNKRIFGYKHHKKLYPGLLSKYEGERLGKGVILIPSGYSKNFLDVFRKMKIKAQIREVFM